MEIIGGYFLSNDHTNMLNFAVMLYSYMYKWRLAVWEEHGLATCTQRLLDLMPVGGVRTRNHLHASDTSCSDYTTD